MYLVIVDEASRYARAIHLFTQTISISRNVRPEEIVFAFITNWEEDFGKPRVLKCQQYVATALQEVVTMSELDIELQALPAGEHLQPGSARHVADTIFDVSRILEQESRAVTTQTIQDVTQAIEYATMAYNAISADRVTADSPESGNTRTLILNRISEVHVYIYVMCVCFVFSLFGVTSL